MRVIFLENIKGVAQAGDIKNVNDGYARNFLLPRNLARPATPEAIKQAEALKKRQEESRALGKEQALRLVKKLEELSLDSPRGIVLEIKEDTNEEGHLYGSVGVKTIAGKLREEGLNVKEDQINLPEHIKTIGEYEIELELHPEVKTRIKIIVLPKAES